MPDFDSRFNPSNYDVGMDMLKQKMWQNLGVDYTPGYQHMDDTQTPDDRMRGVVDRGQPDTFWLKSLEGQMEKELKRPMLEKLDQTPQPTALHPMAAALQGQQDPAMSALFSQPAPKLQQMAGDVVPFPENAGIEPGGKYPLTLEGIQQWKKDLAGLRTQQTLNRALGVSNVIPMTPQGK